MSTSESGTHPPEWMLACIRCPITQEDLSLAENLVVERLRADQANGSLVCTLGMQVMETFEGGLVNRSGSYFYPIRDGIPCLVPGEAIAIGKLRYL